MRSRTLTVSRTEAFEATLGLIAGYDHDNIGGPQTEQIVRMWQDAAADARRRLLVPWTVSVVVHPATVVYANEHGCPPDGERLVVLTGTRNPMWIPDEDAGRWRRAVEDIYVALLDRLDQVTGQITFSSVEHAYWRLTDDA